MNGSTFTQEHKGIGMKTKILLALALAFSFMALLPGGALALGDRAQMYGDTNAGGGYHVFYCCGDASDLRNYSPASGTCQGQPLTDNTDMYDCIDSFKLWLGAGRCFGFFESIGYSGSHQVWWGDRITQGATVNVDSYFHDNIASVAFGAIVFGSNGSRTCNYSLQ